MIPFEQALRIIEASVNPLSKVRTPFTKALNRILAQDVLSDVDMPPFDKAAMDGYACREADLGNELEIVEEIPAGKPAEKKIGLDQCARIMTGAMVPEGADFILMKEHAEISASGKVRCFKTSKNGNICYRGEDIRSGEVVLKSGTRLLPAHMAMLAASGCTNPEVYSFPGVAVISTGNELEEPDEKPDTGKIRNSNGYQLAAQVMQMGIPSDYLGIVRDEENLLYRILKDAIKKYEVVLISGGVSVGDYDFVPHVLQRLKVELLFRGMNVKPGKHLLFGKMGNHVVVGMPGNPVSSFVQFEVLVKPLLNRLMGCTNEPVAFRLPMEQIYTRTKNDTLFFIPVTFTEKGTVLPLEYHGSAHIHAYTMANGIMEVPVGVCDIKRGNWFMFDRYNRHINYLRISVTDRCNLRCRYCMLDAGIHLIPHGDILTFEEITEVVQAAVRMGIDKIRLTGGEPLVRKGITDLVAMIAAVPGITDLAMTTNGLCLGEYAQMLKMAGLQRVNVSLDTLDPARYSYITRGGDITRVLEGIQAARRASLDPIKINCVVFKAAHETDAAMVREYAAREGFQVRFIRQMDLESGEFSVVEGGNGGNCSVCNRLRLTANGMVKPCLFDEQEFSIRELGAETALIKALESKPRKGCYNRTGSFYGIGG